MKVVTNNHSQPIMLGDGTMLAAASTDGSTKTVADLKPSEEKRLLRHRLVSVVEQELQVVQSPKARVPSAGPQVKEEKE